MKSRAPLGEQVSPTSDHPTTGYTEQPQILEQLMKQSFFNCILHLLEERPEQDKQMIGLGASALWERFYPLPLFQKSP